MAPLRWLLTGFSSALDSANGFIRRLLVGRKQVRQKRKALQPSPTVEFWDVQRLGTLSVHDVTGVAVVMPCVDARLAMDTAQLLAKRAGMVGRILVVNDSLRQGFIKTMNDTAARLSVRYVVYLAQDTYPGRNWLRDAYDTMERSGKGLLGFNDGTYKGRIATFGMVRTEWVKGLYGGPIFHPGYECHGADNELTVIARATDMYTYEPNCTLVEYDPDKESKPGHKTDARLFRQRFMTAFDGSAPAERLVMLAEEYKVKAYSIS